MKIFIFHERWHHIKSINDSILWQIYTSEVCKCRIDIHQTVCRVSDQSSWNMIRPLHNTRYTDTTLPCFTLGSFEWSQLLTFFVVNMSTASCFNTFCDKGSIVT